MLLPRITPIAEGQEDFGLLESAADQHALGGGEEAFRLRFRSWSAASSSPAWSWPGRRRNGAHPVGGDDVGPFAGASARTPAQAARLGADLARLIDAVETENANLSGLERLVPETLSEHWQKTVEFLEIVTRAWPGYLQAQGLASPMARRNHLVLAQAARLAARPPAGPVIVAGVTGSVPATTELMRAVSRLAHGAIVLPALDQSLDAETWAMLADGDAGHPQRGLRVLLDRLEVARESVQTLPGCAVPRGARAAQCRRHRGHAAGVGNAALARVCRPHRPGGAYRGARRHQPDRGPARAGRGRSHRAHPAPCAGDAGSHRGACLARPAARPPRRHAARKLGHSRRRFGRPPVRQDRARRISRSRHRCCRVRLPARRDDGRAQASTDQARAAGRPGAARGACPRACRLSYHVPRARAFAASRPRWNGRRANPRAEPAATARCGGSGMATGRRARDLVQRLRSCDGAARRAFFGPRAGGPGDARRRAHRGGRGSGPARRRGPGLPRCGRARPARLPQDCLPG